MKYLTVSASVAAALSIAAACTNIVTVHEYHSGKPQTRTDTVYVMVDPTVIPEEGGGAGSPEGSGSGYTDPWTTYYELYGGARVETCTYPSGSAKHTLQGNTVTGSGPGLVTDAVVWREDNLITDLELLLEFQPQTSVSGATEEASSGAARTRTDRENAIGESDSDTHAETVFLRIRSGDQRYTYELDDCTSVDVRGENQQVSVDVALPVSLALLRDMACSNSVSITVSYPGTDSFTKYFTEMNDGNMYQFYTLFVVGDGNPTPPPVER